MSGAKRVFKIELEELPANAAAAIAPVLARLGQDGRKAAMTKEGAVPVLSIDGGGYQLTLMSAAASGIGAPCALLREL